MDFGAEKRNGACPFHSSHQSGTVISPEMVHAFSGLKNQSVSKGYIL